MLRTCHPELVEGCACYAPVILSLSKDERAAYLSP